jgi:hypothetical protein
MKIITGGIKSWWFGRYRVQLYWPRFGLTELDGMYQGWFAFQTSARLGFRCGEQLGGFKMMGFGIGIHRNPVVPIEQA